MTDSITEELSKGLDKKYVAQRQGSGSMKLDYIESHHAIREANRIFGFDGWNRETVYTTVVAIEKNDKGNHVVSYTAKVKVLAIGTTREGTGFGQGIDRDLGKAHESAIKEAESDAMKRALMTFGDPFGLALYDKSKAHVVSEPAKKKAEVKAETENQDDRKARADRAFAILVTDGDQDKKKALFEQCKADAKETAGDWVDILEQRAQAVA